MEKLVRVESRIVMAWATWIAAAVLLWRRERRLAGA